MELFKTPSEAIQKVNASSIRLFEKVKHVETKVILTYNIYDPPPPPPPAPTAMGRVFCGLLGPLFCKPGTFSLSNAYLGIKTQ